MLNNVYLIDCDTVKAITDINYNVEDDTLGPAIRSAQNVYLREIIGDGLLTSVQEKVSGGTIDNPENAAYLDLLDNYILNYLAFQAQVNAVNPLSYKLRNIGVSQDSDTNIQAQAYDVLNSVESDLNTYAVDAANRLRCYLRSNKDAFPELSETPCVCGACDNGPDLRLKANTNLWLG